MNLNSNLSLQTKSTNLPLRVFLKRSGTIESVHRVHVVVCDNKGRILMSSGDPNYESFIRSSLKPFQALPFISSGAYEQYKFNDKSIAIACSSHCGSKAHSREVFKILWNSDINVSFLQCPIPHGLKSPLEHNCSGKHAAFLSTCRKLKWPIDNYLNGSHPLQQEIIRRVADFLCIPAEELVAARDDCGAPTLTLRLSQMALLYALLGSSNLAEMEQICRAILANPLLISGEGRFDTELMYRGHGQLISKGGAEGIQCISNLGERMGIAIKVEDGSKRAKHAVAIHLLNQLGWITPIAHLELEEKFLLKGPGLNLEVDGSLGFQET